MGFPWVSPGLSDKEKETTSFGGGRRGHMRKTVRMERNVWDNRSNKTEIWVGKDGLQLGLLGGHRLCREELVLKDEWKSKTSWAKSCNKNTCMKK